jgi:hypothetical protein
MSRLAARGLARSLTEVGLAAYIRNGERSDRFLSRTWNLAPVSGTQKLDGDGWVDFERLVGLVVKSDEHSILQKKRGRR